MKQHLTIISALTLCAATASAEKVTLNTPNLSFVLEVSQGTEPQFRYFGPRLTSADIDALEWHGDDNWSSMNIYPAYGATHTMNETCLAMRHADGNLSTQLVTQKYELGDVADIAPNGAPRSGRKLTITLSDPIYATTVLLHYQAYSDVDMLESWTEITNGEKKTVTLTQFYNPLLPVRVGDVWCSHFYGSWAAEGQLVDEPLHAGILEIKNKDGLRNATSSRNEVMLSLDGRPQENSGAVIGAALLYSGNFRITIDTDESDYHQYFAGINPDNSEYHLRHGETFTTPRSAYTYSERGTNGVSQNFHRWARRYQLRHGNQERMILLNSWEGVYFDINQEGMAQMMADIASMGGELFVMDDGWFGSKYPRAVDNAALGDWTVDVRKLPKGIEGLLADARRNNVKFGIWIEPEMANTTSELYEQHPDWVLKVPNRDAVMGRGGTQVVLDMANPKVQEHVFGVVDRLLSQYPEIAYIKWDANAPIMNHGSQYLPAADQSHLYIAYHNGLIDVCRHIREKYPDVIIQCCASGGGRANYGLLPYFDEFWVSDDTDALQRVRMQWGTSYFFPAIAMASHISACPNHQTFRTVPLKYRIDVAMSGRLGMEIQPKHMTDDEKELCRRAIADYKQIRPVVQFGNLYRLHSPYAGDNLASLMYVSDDRRQAVFYWYKLETFKNQHLPRIKMQGLDPDKRYVIRELNRIDSQPLACEGKSYSGAYLMSHGLELPYRHIVDYHKQNDWCSRVLQLTAE
ncbi:MAG: alpha-galactosidase [Bacteroidales bacterium]|jgi:alpha-galactosidase|nr:alpha-galactosidase [Bacteroidales bacterium]